MKILLRVFLLVAMGSVGAIAQEMPANTVDCDNANGIASRCTVEADELAKAEPSVSLAWKASTSHGVTSYRMLRSSSNAGPFVAIRWGITGTTYTDKTVVAGETYYYEVRADCPTCAPPLSKMSNHAKAVIP
jgi:hypothetical protein